jgi:hypothetical protein
MTPPRFIIRLMGCCCLACLLVVIVMTGCSKKEPESSAPTANPDNAAAPAGAATTADPGLPAGAGAVSPPIPAETTKSLTAVDAALKAKDYDRAAETILALQRQKQLTDEQARAAQAQMVRLQGALVSAVASGDPNAKAAADRLRQASKH